MSNQRTRNQKRMRHIKKLLAFSRGAEVFALTFSLFLGGCGGRRPLSRTDLFKMGDRAQIGSLTYNVIDADWKTQLGEPPNAKGPEHPFLVLHVSITNCRRFHRDPPPVPL